MADLGLLAVAEGSVVSRGSGAGVAGHGDVEEGGFEGLGGTEGADDDAGLEGLVGEEELDGEVLLGLLYFTGISFRLLAIESWSRLKNIRCRQHRGRCP